MAEHDIEIFKEELATLKTKIENFERRWRDLKIASIIVGVCLVAFLGYTFTAIPKKVEKAFEQDIANKARQTAEKAEKQAMEAAKTAEKTSKDIQSILAQAKSTYDKIQKIYSSGAIDSLTITGDITWGYGKQIITNATNHYHRKILETGWEKIGGDFVKLYVPGDNSELGKQKPVIILRQNGDVLIPGNIILSGGIIKPKN
jgi:hypothetical protein